MFDYNQRFERLCEVCRKFSASLELEPLLQLLTATGVELTGSEACSILVYRHETHALHFIAGDERQLDLLKQVSVPLDRSVAGWVFRHGEPAVSSEAATDERIYRVVDRELSGGTRTLVAAPMIYQGKTLGVMEAINKTNDTNYTGDDILILETLAAQAAVALENKNLMDESQQAYQQGVELQKMKSDFMAIVSHELRTPLGLILGHAALLQETCDDAVTRQGLKVIEENVLRLREIIDRFSDFERIERGTGSLLNRMVRMVPLARDTIESFREMASGKNISLSLTTSGDRWVVLGDRDQLATVLGNLVQNALTFTDAGGRVEVQMEGTANQIQVSVIDTGIGIPTEEQEKVFERFYQVERHLTRQHGGLGLGLSIAKELVELYGGRIWVDSVEGVGSQFCFQLPAKLA